MLVIGKNVKEMYHEKKNTMFRHILVPLDGSACAEQALSLAACLVRASRGMLTLFQAIDLASEVSPYGIDAPYLAPQRIEDDFASARRYLEQRSRTKLLAGLPVQTRVTSGNAAEAILAQATEPGEGAEDPIDLIVMSSHGYTGMKRWFLGSVAEKVARHALIPVLILRDRDLLLPQDRTRPVRVLVPLDASPRSQDALVPAAQLGAALSPDGQGTLHLAHMIVPPERCTLSEIKELLQVANQNLATIGETMREEFADDDDSDLHPVLSWSATLTDDMAEGIVRMAENGEEHEDVKAGQAPAFDFIALTTQGLSGIHRWQGGSMAGRVLHSTHLPILLIRSQEVTRKDAQPLARGAEAKK